MPEEIETQPEEMMEEKPKAGFLEKLKLHRFKILGGALGVFVLAGAVFGAYKLGQRQVRSGPQPTPTPITEATPTPDPTANWKTYQYTEVSEYAYSIKYPPDWSFKEGPGGLIVDFGPVTFHSPGKSYIYSRVTLLKEGGFTFEEIVNNAKLYLDDLKEESIKVQGLDATKLSGTMDEKSNPAEIGYYSQQIYVKRDNGIYLLGLVQNPQEDYKQTFNLMLSTFKFVE